MIKEHPKFVLSLGTSSLIINCSQNANQNLEQYGPLKNGPYNIMSMIREQLGSDVLKVMEDISSELSEKSMDEFYLTGEDGYFEPKVCELVSAGLRFSREFDARDILAMVYLEFQSWVRKNDPVVLSCGELRYGLGVISIRPIKDSSENNN